MAGGVHAGAKGQRWKMTNAQTSKGIRTPILPGLGNFFIGCSIGVRQADAPV